MVFVNSMSDLFHEDVPVEFLDRVLAMIAYCRQHTFQVLTKRPIRMLEYLSALPARAGKGKRYLVIDFDDPERVLSIFRGDGWPLPNLWLGVSVEDQASAEERIPLLLQSPAAVRFVSAEPVLDEIDLGCVIPFGFDEPDRTPLERLDWVIVGGESGPRARPMHPNWARSLRDQCRAAEVPFFFKQWGEWVDPRQVPEGVFPGLRVPAAQRLEDGTHVWRAGKKAAGRLLDGRTWDEYPASSSTISDDGGLHRQKRATAGGAP